MPSTAKVDSGIFFRLIALPSQLCYRYFFEGYAEQPAHHLNAQGTGVGLYESIQQPRLAPGLVGGHDFVPEQPGGILTTVDLRVRTPQ